ncbi:hypothetical protein OPT61_g4797 [Boeremia exigua]|uniref:Uncharacterized protein n=1 Tax=Boeremia exigua TaxID=749465 RepID=A0ACC2ICX3_9PLEO|nr:hypothetical protein OPT61_g4797 [Boeremia exigua]
MTSQGHVSFFETGIILTQLCTSKYGSYNFCVYALNVQDYDDRNPVYYVRRAGYPPTETEFYKSNGKKPTYDQVSFV